jgi:hypothetical protein
MVSLCGCVMNMRCDLCYHCSAMCMGTADANDPIKLCYKGDHEYFHYEYGELKCVF